MSVQSGAISSREQWIQILGRQIDHRGSHSSFQCLQANVGILSQIRQRTLPSAS